MKLVELLGPQPILNLLPMRYLKPDEVLFVGTPDTHDISRHLQALMQRYATIHLTEVRDPHDPFMVHQFLQKKLRKLGWLTDDVVFDLSDGTKMESFALAKLAKDSGALIVDTELIHGRYRLRRYQYEGDHAILRGDDPLPDDLITIEDYLYAHVPGYQVGGAAKDASGQVDIGGRFEEAIFRALEPHVDEVLAGVRPAGVAEQIEIDLMIGRGNRVGIIEAKTSAKKAGIDQLDTAGSSRFLGAHLVKFLVTGRYLSWAHKMLALAESIRVVELPGYRDRRRLPDQEHRHLIMTVTQALDGR